MDTTLAELAEHFDKSRNHLRAVAFRILGSADEADDAVQDAWLRACRGGADGVADMTAWLTTIVARICLDMLRSRRRRREEFTDMSDLDAIIAHDDPGPEEEAVRANSVGLALLVVLDTLGPAERIAYVLHDLFAVPFDAIAEILQRTPAAAKKLASRARHRVHGTAAVPAADLARQRRVVEAFLAASRAGDLPALLAVLAPDVVRHADAAALRRPARTELRGAHDVARETLSNAARAFYARPILVDGAMGVVVAPEGRLRLVLRMTIDGDRITAIDVVADPGRLRALHLALADPAPAP
ncbi:RNA polymerase sigma-70 factor (ECF subfamily) [Thermocatellispora tengchongensis]|uniref:RNA polymerase sigma-70 factor (ECF subfamily) n=1 Tax=Thermocatellispora tengchongensis TaxID=1073253 RepID=A0A840P4K9_9ACTN|nr:sigma-70 family RNA polymerase sigma factor [Thermocatellispora tengchongensis]MBB5132420.1 RNA polymerase sigma-70 factor (ECF subfamily) [Thermocatellispora tengchongensis]